MAAVPKPKYLPDVLMLFGQGRSAVESHATQVNIVDREGRLIWRTQELPSADSIARILVEG
jgi:protein SCO1/2